jgi:YHS domain-containing protein
MTGPIRLAGRLALCGILLWVFQNGGAALGGPCLAHPCSNGCLCIPNAQGYGFFDTRWRQWPGEPRPDINFPQSIGAEVVPTPQGQRQLPPSKAKVTPGKPPFQPGVLPPEEGLQPGRGTPFLPEPPVAVPGEPRESPAKPPGEAPAKPPVKTPAEPPTKTPAEAPAERPPNAPPEAPKKSAAVPPRLRSSWAALAEEPPGARPLLGSNWFGHLPTRLPDTGGPVPSGAPAGNTTLAIPGAETALPRRAPRSVAEERVNIQESGVSMAFAKQPPAETSDTLQANWPAALDPGSPAEIGRSMGGNSWAGRPVPQVGGDGAGGNPILPPAAQSVGTRSEPMVSQPSPERFPPRSLQANWSAALGPGLRALPPTGPMSPGLASGNPWVGRPAPGVSEDTFGRTPTFPLAPDRAGAAGRPAGDQPFAERSPTGTIQANWTAALDPGLRGETAFTRPPDGAALGGNPSAGPVPATYHEPLESEAASSARIAAPGTDAKRWLGGGGADSSSTATEWKVDSGPWRGQPSPSGPDSPSPIYNSQPPISNPQRPASNPLIALDGYCPVELGEKEHWTPGNPRWPVVYEGRTYLCSGPMQRQRFLAAPDRYAPAYSGHDPVLVVDGNRRVPGQTDFCVIFDGRLYMFSSSATLARFKNNPQRYAVPNRQ